jgi:hypothetical protein
MLSLVHPTEFLRSWLAWMPQIPGKVVEDAQVIAIQIGDPKLAQVPRLIRRLSKGSQSFAPTLSPNGQTLHGAKSCQAGM